MAHLGLLRQKRNRKTVYFDKNNAQNEQLQNISSLSDGFLYLLVEIQQISFSWLCARQLFHIISVGNFVASAFVIPRIYKADVEWTAFLLCFLKSPFHNWTTI
jgi:hypothetical protein